jgi:hypothetical protein
VDKGGEFHIGANNNNVQLGVNWVNSIQTPQTPAMEAIKAKTADQLALNSDGQAMLSFVFAMPDSVTISELVANEGYLNVRSAHAWNIFVIGYAIPQRHGNVVGGPATSFDVQAFEDVRRAIPSTWRYSGLCDVVSVMAYHDQPGLFDWQSLRSVTITGPDGTYIDRSFGQITEIMSDWRHDPEGLTDYAPGEVPHDRTIAVPRLEAALRFLAGAVGGGVAGNFAYDLLKQITN